MPRTDILRAIERVGQLTNHYLSARFAQLSLTDLEVHVLMYLEDRPQASIADIQRTLALRPSTLTHVLDRLENRGYLSRRLNPNDRRSLLVLLTPDGQSVASTVVELLLEFDGAIRERVDEQALAGFRAVLEAVVYVTHEGKVHHRKA